MGWNRGDMRFTNRNVRPANMSMDEWFDSDLGRTWVSKKDESPSQFLARILSDMGETGKHIFAYLEQEIGKAGGNRVKCCQTDCRWRNVAKGQVCLRCVRNQEDPRQKDDYQKQEGG